MSRPDLHRVRAGLRDFQRDTVDYVASRMFDPVDPARRFLVADEVGLGKTFVARGIVAETIDRLWDDVPRIDIVYICSNGQIARQNISRLAVDGAHVHAVADRLTMLPRVAHTLQQHKVNIVAFTPGTSLAVGNAPGKHPERIVLYWLLRKVWGARLLNRSGAIELLRGGVGAQRFKGSLGSRSIPLDAGFVADFEARLATRPDLRTRFEELSDGRTAGRTSPALTRRMNKLLGELRSVVAHASIAALEPDLIILDEFQRFTSILDGDDEAATLARALFDFPDARTLLLSATPYRMLTLRGDDPAEGDHLKDLLRTVGFLLQDQARTAVLEEDLASLRRGLTQGAPVESLLAVQARIEEVLRSVMVRTERLGATEDRGGMLVAMPRADLVPTAADVGAFHGAQAVSDDVLGGGLMDYWKSAPYLLTFLDGYTVRRKLDRALAAHGAAVRLALGRGPVALDLPSLDRYRPVDAGHPKLRSLVDDLEVADAFSLLWIPPALPTTALSGPYASPAAGRFTKRLVFSAWTAVPRAVATLLSYEAERRTLGSTSGAAYDERVSRGLLRIASRQGRPANMATFALLMPIPSLVRLADPLAFAERTGSPLPVSPDALLAYVRAEVGRRLEPHVSTAPDSGRVDQDWYWAALLLLDEDVEWWTDPTAYQDAGVTADDDGADASSGLAQHAQVASAATDDLPALLARLGRPPADLLDVVATLAVTGPASIAFRALDAVVAPDDRRQWASEEYFPTRDAGVRDAAVHLARALRALFQQPEAEALVESYARSSREAGEDFYWRAVLEYSLAGGLGAVLQENLHMLVEANGLGDKPWDQALFGEDAAEEWTDDGLVVAFAKQVLLRRSGVTLQGFTRTATGVTRSSKRLRHHFAVRFGSDRIDDASEQRATNVREAFNGPFWPFVLVSTSVGQEGLDFHPYSHAVVHWNLPHNPVDLEQREGRVHRYKGHAVRKNLASRYGSRPEIVRTGDPWARMFDLAVRERPSGVSDLVPFWVLPAEGGAAIERHVPMLALSADVQRYHDLVRTLGLYRLSFGQARQQDLLELLQESYSEEELSQLVQKLRIDLSPRKDAWHRGP
jgi:hypothetical protein